MAGGLFGHWFAWQPQRWSRWTSKLYSWTLTIRSFVQSGQDAFQCQESWTESGVFIKRVRSSIFGAAGAGSTPESRLKNWGFQTDQSGERLALLQTLTSHISLTEASERIYGHGSEGLNRRFARQENISE